MSGSTVDFSHALMVGAAVGCTIIGILLVSAILYYVLCKMVAFARTVVPHARLFWRYAATCHAIERDLLPRFAAGALHEVRVLSWHLPEIRPSRGVDYFARCGELTLTIFVSLDTTNKDEPVRVSLMGDRPLVGEATGDRIVALNGGVWLLS